MNNKIKCDNNKFKYLNEWIRKKNNIDLMNKYINIVFHRITNIKII